MRFWCVTIMRYVLATVAALLVSFLAAYVLMIEVLMPLADNPASGPDATDGITGFFYSAVFACLLVPITLGVTAEIIERTAQGRRFNWHKALFRSLLAVPIWCAPFHFLDFLVGSSPRLHWVTNQAALNCVSAIFAFLALRIKRDSTISQT